MARNTKQSTASAPASAAKKTSKAETKAATPVKAAAPAAEPVTETAQDNGLADTFSDFAAKLQAMSAAFTSLKSDFRAMEREATRKLKAAQKDSARRKRKTGSRQPSGFVKPTLISNELASFLKKPAGTEMARTEVTREINAYIRSNNLQDKSNGRKINPDSALSKLLKLKKSDELTYFNLQRFMSPHFAKATASAAK